MLATLSLILWIAGAYFMVRFRIHIHITTEERLPRVKPRPEPVGGSSVADITSALVNQGCERKKAGSIARKVCAETSDFNEQLRKALREAA